MKHLKKQTNVVLILVLFFCAGFDVSVLSADVDPFYTKLLREGKTFYAEGKYREAIENFRIGEFGLLEEKEVLAELYLFYSLAYLKVGRLEEAREIIKKFETELNIKDLDTLPVPPLIEIDVKVMMTILKNQEENTGGTKKTGGRERTASWKKVYDFERQFRDILKNLEDNNLGAVKNNIKKLEKIDKKNTRIHYIQGILKFKEKRYKACTKALNKVKPSSLVNGSDRSLLDNFYYYLALSHHYLNNMEQRRAYSEGISDEALKARLKKIIAETKAREEKTEKSGKKIREKS